MAAAVLHDTIEDTNTREAELRDLFNADVAELVAEVTDDKSLDKDRRKEIQIETASRKSDRAKVLKLADKTSNLRSIAKSPPTDWSHERRLEYLEWAEGVAVGLRGVNPWIEDQFDDATRDLRNVLKL